MTTYSIAQIIQGEAATPAGQFAVASTIYNRARNGGFGGSDPLAVANAPGQFTGHLNSPSGPGAVPTTVSPTAQTFADAVQNGTLTNYGNPGNALFFQSNQGQPSTVVGGASVNIGGNYFTDRAGQPSPNFVPPSYGGTAFSTPANTSDQPGDADPLQHTTTSTSGNGDSVTMNPSDPNYGDITNIPVAGVNAPAESGLTAATAPTGTNPTGSGAPVNIQSDQPLINAANALSKALGGQTAGATADTSSAVGAGTSWLNSIFGEGTDLLARGGFILLGLVMLLGALVFFYIDSRTSNVPVTA